MEFHQSIVQWVSIVCSAEVCCPPCFTFDDISSMSPYNRWHTGRHCRHAIYVAQAKVCDACHFWHTCKHSHCERDISRVQLNSRLYLCPPSSRDLPLLWHVHDGHKCIRARRLRRGRDDYPVPVNTIRTVWCLPEQRWNPLGYRDLQLVRPLLLNRRSLCVPTTLTCATRNALLVRAKFAPRITITTTAKMPKILHKNPRRCVCRRPLRTGTGVRW